MPVRCGLLLVFGLLIGYACGEETLTLSTTEPLPTGTLCQVETTRDKPIALQRDGSRQTIPTQLLEGTPNRLVWRLRSPLEANTSRSYRVLPAIRPPKSVGYRFRQNEDNLSLDHAERNLFEYRLKSPAVPKQYRSEMTRSGYLHPIRTRSGEVVTGDFPKDHPHQRGLFFAWVKCALVEQEGKTSLDFWNLGKGLATVRHDAVLQQSAGPLAATLTVRRSFAKREDHGKSFPILNDQWRLTTFGEKRDQFIDVVSTQRNLTETPLKVQEYHYGGFAFRGHLDWQHDPASKLTWKTSEGHDRIAGNHTRARWVRFGGLLRGKPVDVVVMSHPENLNYPEHVRLHPGDPYFCFVPVLERGFTFEPQSPRTWRYRVWISESQPSLAEIEQAHRRFIHPPRITWKGAGSP